MPTTPTVKFEGALSSSATDLFSMGGAEVGLAVECHFANTDPSNDVTVAVWTRDSSNAQQWKFVLSRNGGFARGTLTNLVAGETIRAQASVDAVVHAKIRMGVPS